MSTTLALERNPVVYELLNLDSRGSIDREAILNGDTTSADECWHGNNATDFTEGHGFRCKRQNYAPGAMSGANMSHHGGREFGFVLEGELVIELGFESYTLKSGDSIILDSTTPHRLINKGTQPMRAVWVVLSPH